MLHKRNKLKIKQTSLIILPKLKSTYEYENDVHDPAYGHAQATLQTAAQPPGTVPMLMESPRQDPHIPPTRISVKDTPIRYMRIILIKQK